MVVPRYGRPVAERNRLRRRLREIGRRRVLPSLDAVDVVLRSHTGAYRATFEQLTSDLDQWLRSLAR